MIRRLLCVILAVFTLFSVIPGAFAAETTGIDLSSWIRKDTYREYVEMMVDYHLRTNESVQSALKNGFSAVFLFDGCSDNMAHPRLSDLSYYRVSGVCLSLAMDEQGAVKLQYFNDDCSTIPDRPLSYGAWSFPEVGEVGPATVCDGTYQLYSVRHKGRYEALHARSDYTDPTLSAVYLTPDGGFTRQRANEINIHTRTDNHILEHQMWSAGCPLVGDGEFRDFEKLMEATYYRVYEEFEVDQYVGTLVIDRMSLRSELYTLYENPDAVDMFLAASRKIQPEIYLRQCTAQALEPKTRKTGWETELRTLPCGNGTDARSRLMATLEPGQKVTVIASVTNTQGNTWVRVRCQGQTGYVYAPYLKDLNFFEWMLDRIFG